MDDTTQQPPAQPEQPDPNQQPQSFTPIVMPKNKLEELPPEIRYDLDALFKNDVNVNKVKTTLEKKWLGKSDVLPAVYTTYKSYYDLHRLRLHKEKEEEAKQLQQTRSELVGLEEFASDVAAGKDVSFRNKYQEILDAIEDRLAYVAEIQSHSFSLPQYEMVMVQLFKSKKEILEKLENYKDKVDEQRHEKNKAYFERFSYELLKAVFDIYNKVNGQTNLAEFRAELKSIVLTISERTLADYDREINEL